MLLETVQQLGQPVINKVYVHNAQEMVVASTFCANLAVYSVGQVNFISSPLCQHQEFLSLTLVDTNANVIPSYVTHLEIEGSSTSKIIITNNLKALSIVRSYVELLDVIHPIQGVVIKIQQSQIDTLKNLKLESKSHLLLRNTTINTLGEKSIYLNEASVSIWNCNIEDSLDHAITLGPKSTLSINNVDGKVTFSGPNDLSGIGSDSQPQPNTMSPHSKPLSLPTPTREASRCTYPSPLFWALPSLLAVVEAIIIMANCTNWFPVLKIGYTRQVVEGGRRIVPGIREEMPSPVYPKWYYSNETHVEPNINRRQKTAYKDN